MSDELIKRLGVECQELFLGQNYGVGVLQVQISSTVQGFYTVGCF